MNCPRGKTYLVYSFLISSRVLKHQFFFQLDRTPPNTNRRSHPPQSQGYDTSLANYGPSSRPPPHPAIHSNPYDDPYYYYGSLEMGAPQAPSLNGPLDSRRGQANRGGLKLDGGMSEGNLGLFLSKSSYF